MEIAGLWAAAREFESRVVATRYTLQEAQQYIEAKGIVGKSIISQDMDGRFRVVFCD